MEKTSTEGHARGGFWDDGRTVGCEPFGEWEEKEGPKEHHDRDEDGVHYECFVLLWSWIWDKTEFLSKQNLSEMMSRCNIIFLLTYLFVPILSLLLSLSCNV